MVHAFLGVMVTIFVVAAIARAVELAWPRRPTPAERAAQWARMRWGLAGAAIIAAAGVIAQLLTH